MPSMPMAYVESLAPVYSYVPYGLQPLHKWLPVGAIDLYGAVRLSMAVNCIADDTKGKPRATVVQEILGILIVVFGGETFLSLCTGNPPSWLINPTFALLFGLTHLVLTRTPLKQLLPRKPKFEIELALAPFDAIGRTLLLTRFSVVPLLHPAPGVNSLPATPSTLLLVPFILAVPAAALVFSATNFFAADLTFQTPAELKSGGWMALDAWLPVVLPAFFLSLIGPVKGWPISLGLNLSEDAAIVVCGIFTVIAFVTRVIVNLGPKQRKTRTKAKKIKKA